MPLYKSGTSLTPTTASMILTNRPVKYKIWGFHFYNEMECSKEFSIDMEKLL